MAKRSVCGKQVQGKVEPKTEEEKHNCLCKHCERAMLYDAELEMNVYEGYLDKED
jgi:hypothetical protein